MNHKEILEKISEEKSVAKNIPSEKILNLIREFEVNRTANNSLFLPQELKGKTGISELSDELFVCQPLPWDGSDFTARPWSETTDSAQMRLYCRTGYGFTDFASLMDLLVADASKNRVNPAKEMILSRDWDGLSRIDSVLCGCLGVADNAYTREVSRNFFLSCVKRIFEPGSSIAPPLVLAGPPGSGKSLFFHSLAGPALASQTDFIGIKNNLIPDPGWILFADIPEWLDDNGFRELWSFASRNKDWAGSPWRRLSCARPRYSVYAFTCGLDHMDKLAKIDLHRFHPLFVPAPAPGLRKELVSLINDKEAALQIWAEAYARYQRGEADSRMLTLTEKAKKAFKETRLQQSDIRIDSERMKVLEFLLKKYPPGFHNLKVGEKRECLQSEEDDDFVCLDFTCSVEISFVVFGKKVKNNTDSRRIGKILQSFEGIEKTTQVKSFGPDVGRQQVYSLTPVFFRKYGGGNLMLSDA